MKIVFVINYNHKASSSHPSFFMLVVILLVFGQRCRRICLKIFSTSPSSTLITLSLLVTGASLRPDLVLVLNNTTEYLLELTVGFESNIKVNTDRKAAKYHSLLTNLQTVYTNCNFVNTPMSALGTFGSSSDSFLQMLNDLNFNQDL